MGGETWRLVGLTSGDGPWNMAVDEAILTAVAAGHSPTTLRLYDWRGPWLSVGCVQSVADVDLGACERAGLPLLRRASGGAAVLHESALAYSLALPPGHPLAAPDVVESYRRLGPPVAAALGRLGVSGRLIAPGEAHRGRPEGLGASACFASLAPYELVVGGRKLVGNSQLRRRGAVLHHSIVPLAFDAARLAGLLRTGSPEERAQLTAYLAQRIGSLHQALGRAVLPAEVAGALVAGFSEALGVRFAPGGLSGGEVAEARRLVEEKYGNREWTHRR